MSTQSHINPIQRILDFNRDSLVRQLTNLYGLPPFLMCLMYHAGKYLSVHSWQICSVRADFMGWGVFH